MKIIFFDSSPLGVISDPASTPGVVAISLWANSHLAAGNRVYVPEVIDYELRRELIRSGKTASLIELDSLKSRLYYAPLTTEAMLLAANLWAQSRNRGRPTGDPKRLDIDVILAAQALTEKAALALPDVEAIVATTNAKHLSQFLTADLWQNILP